MSSLGELYFQLGLDDKKFNDAIEAAKQKVKELGADVEIGVKLDLEGLKKEIQNAAKATGGGSLEIGAKVNTSGLENLYSMLEASKKEAKELEEAIAKTTAESVKVQKQAELDGVRRRIADQEAKILAKGGSLDASKATIVKVELDEESINQVKARLTQLEHPITPKVSIEYDQEKFRAVATTLENYTKRLNELGTVRLGIDDSFIRTGVGQNKKGLNGWLSNISDYLLGDDTGDAGKSIKSIQKVLDNYTFKVKAEVDAQKLVASISGAVKKVPVDINVDIEAVKKKLKQLGVPLNFNMTQAIADAKTKLKDQEFKAKLNLVIDKAKVSKAIKEAFAKKGLEYQATPSDVRNARILEIQQRMEQRQQKFNGQVKKGNASMRKLGSSTRNASDWAGQLSNQFNNLVSFYALERFIRNLYTIGGEFQKQQIALQNMIGDVDRGNAIFERMKDLAVKSPFTFSDLASYTKQMSAYGIEYENLYDTTKRLADISAGVGVDMGRLILAFGQVRSAAVLRGQELRQFTEAGIPLVAELAKKFTELEGRVVSTGEVFDKISKREVSFGMVKDILFDMTDPGGRFFETQEKLAESLAGKWSNLKDAWDIMIADIANGNNSVLSGLADIINSLIRGFETWLPFVSGAIVALGLLRGAITAVNIVSTASPWVLIGSVMAGVVSTVISLASETETATELITRLNRELEGVVAQNNDNERNANRYLDILKKQADSESDKYALYQKQKAAFEELLKLYPKATEIAELELMTLEEIEKTRKRIAEQTKKDNLNQYDVRIDEAYDAYEKKRIDTEKILRDSGKTIEDFPETKKELEALYNLYTNAMNAKEMYEQSFIDAARPKPLADWQIKADEIIAKYPNIAALKRDKGDDIWAYFDFLEATFKEAKEKYDRVTSESMKKPYKSIMDAVNAVNMGIGGVSLYDSKKKKGGKSEAEKAAERDAKAYLEALKNEVARTSEKWSLFKELADATGDKDLAMKIAFDGKAVAFESELEWLKHRIQEEAKKANLDMSVADLLGLGEKQLIDKGVEEKVAKSIGHLIETYNKSNKKLSVDTVKEFAEIIKASRNFEEQIAAIDAKLQEDLTNLKVVYKDNPTALNFAEAEAKKRAEEEKSKVRFEQFKEDSNWVKIFDDLDRVSANTIYGMIDRIEEFAKSTNLSQDEVKQLMDALGKLREKTFDFNPFGSLADSIKRVNELRNMTKKTNAYGVTLYDRGEGYGANRYMTEEEYGNALQSAESDIVKSINGISNKFDDLKNVLDPLVDLFGGADTVFGKIIGGLSNALGGASSMSNSFSSLLGLQIGSGETAKSLGSMLGISNAGFWGAVAGAGISIATTLMDVFGADYSSYNKMKEEYDILLGVWDSLIERKQKYIDIDYADEGRKVGQEALELLNKQIEAYRILGKERLNAGASAGSHSIGVRIKKGMSEEGWEQYNKAMKSMGLNADWVAKDRMESLFNLSGEQLAELQEKAPVFWAKLDEDVREYLNNIIESNEALEEMRKTLNETLTGTSLDSFYDNYISMLQDLDSSNLEFAQSFEEYLKNAIIANVIGNKYKDSITKLYEDWAAYSDSNKDNVFDLTPEESDALKKAQESLTEQLIAEREALKEAFGWTDSNSASSGLSKGIQGVSEDTANLLASYVNSMRADLSVNRTLIEQLVSVDVPQMSIIAQAQLQQLQQVAANTKRNADAADRIYELVNKVVDKGSNKLKI